MSNLVTTADSILLSAQRLIIAGGYNGFSYADIAKEVGIRNASIHHHFPSKSGLVCALVAGYRQRARSGLDELARQVPAPIDRLRAYVGYWQACIADSSQPFCLCAMLAAEIPVLPAEVTQEVRSYFEALAAWLTAAFEQGHAEDVLTLAGLPDAEAQTFMAAVHGAMLSARAYGDAGVFATVTDALLERITPRR